MMMVISSIALLFLVTFSESGRALKLDEDSDWSGSTDLDSKCSLYWKTSSDSITLKLVVQGNSWIGLGWNPDPDAGEMSNADMAILSQKGDQFSLVDSWSTGFISPDPDNEDDLQGKLFGQDAQSTWLQFTRPWVTQDKKQDKDILQGKNFILWAYGSTPDMRYHGKSRGHTYLDFTGTGKVNTETSDHHHHHSEDHSGDSDNYQQHHYEKESTGDDGNTQYNTDGLRATNDYEKESNDGNTQDNTDGLPATNIYQTASTDADQKVQGSELSFADNEYDYFGTYYSSRYQKGQDGAYQKSDDGVDKTYDSVSSSEASTPNDYDDHYEGAIGDDKQDQGVYGDDKQDQGASGDDNHDQGVHGDDKQDQGVSGDDYHDQGLPGDNKQESPNDNDQNPFGGETQDQEEEQKDEELKFVHNGKEEKLFAYFEKQHGHKGGHHHRGGRERKGYGHHDYDGEHDKYFHSRREGGGYDHNDDHEDYGYGGDHKYRESDDHGKQYGGHHDGYHEKGKEYHGEQEHQRSRQYARY